MLECGSRPLVMLLGYTSGKADFQGCDVAIGHLLTECHRQLINYFTINVLNTVYSYSSTFRIAFARRAYTGPMPTIQKTLQSCDRCQLYTVSQGGYDNSQTYTASLHDQTWGSASKHHPTSLTINY